jgi:PAS domain S-box-containing protein
MLSLLFSDNPLPMWVFDRETLRFLTVNDAAVQRYGYSQDEFLTMTIADLRAPEDVPWLLQELSKPRPPWAHFGVARHRTRDGTSLFVDITSHAVSLDGRDAVLVVAPDVTERIEAERAARQSAEEERAAREALEASERRFRWMTDAIDDVFWISSVDIDRLLYVSPAYEKIWGRSLESVYARPSSFIEAIHPDDRERVTQLFADTRGRPSECEFRVVRPDGSVRWVRDRAYPIEEPDRSVLAMTGVVSDITELRHQTELVAATNTLLQQSERKYRELVENLSEVVWSIDIDGAIDYVSPAVQAFGYRPDQLVGQSFRSMVHDDDLPRVEAALAEATAGGVVSCEFRMMDSGGAYRDVRTSSRRRVRGEHITGFTGSLMDITEQRLLAEQMRAAQRLEALGQLAGGIAHDFNNLLVAINGYAELAMQQLPGVNPVRDDLKEILRAGNRAGAMTRQLLAFGRRQVLHASVVNLNEVITGIEPMLTRLIRENVRVETSLDPGLGNIRVDEVQIEQVILNLVINARDAMPDGGVVRISTRPGPCPAAVQTAARGAGCVLLSVSDTGVGMDEETRRRIFEPFFTTKAAAQGTGLGLSTVYGIVQQSGGAIDVQTAPGRGTTFTIAFPAARTPGASATPQPADSHAAAGETILLAEDEALVRQLTERLLSSAGYRVLTAASGGEALKVVTEADVPIDLLLTDVVMPEMSGCELAQQMSKLVPDLQVLFMSGYTGDDSDIADLLRDRTVLEKPFGAAELKKRVRDALDRRRPVR